MRHLKRKLGKLCASLLTFVLVLTPLSLVLSPRVLAAGTLPDPISFTSIDFALKNTMYVSNTVTLKNFTGPLTATVTGGTGSILVKNNVDAGASVSVIPGDLLAVKTTSATADNITNTMTIKVGTLTTTWVVKTVPMPTIAAVAGTNSGYTSGQFSVGQTGAASYSIPLVTAPGSGNLQPSLALNYSNQSGNGILGVGWSLAGLSTVTRCPAITGADGYADTVDFDGNDRFCLDGEKLIAVTGTYGANNTEYRTEHDTFSRIVSYGTVGDGPTNFKLWTKSGLIMEFGNTADSRVEAQGRSNVLFWAVNRIQDTNGNYMTVTYAETNATSEFLVTRIDYTGNAGASLVPYASVQFTYADRLDKEIRFVEGSQVAVTKRLVNIKNIVETTLVREYRLTYQNDGVSQRSELKTLQECGLDGSCLGATTFDWNGVAADTFTFNGAGTGMWTGHDGGMANNFLGDYNGDGKTDIMKYSTVAGQWRVKLGFGTDFADGGLWVGHSGGPTNNVTGDFNGDGKTDIAGYTGADGNWHVCYSTGSISINNGFNCSFMRSHSGGAAQNFSGDFNGDGRTDMMRYADAPNVGKWRMWLSTGTAFTDAGLWEGHSGGPANNVVADFNGDGKSDIMGYAGNGQWHVALSTGSNFQQGSAGQMWAGHSGGQTNNVVADFNGDSKSDIAGYAGNGQWHVCLSKGNSFTCSFWAGHSGGITNNKIGDFNGDGRADMAGYTGSGGTWHVVLSNGSSFNMPGSGMWPGHSGGAGLSIVGDFNGDGKSDMAGYTNNVNMWHVTLPGGAFPDLLSKITNGHGVVTTINYKPLTDLGVYSKGNSAVYPRYDFQGPLYVVYSYSTSNGIGGTSTYTYKYSAGEMNLIGRGFRGFKTVEMTDNQTGYITRSTYSLDYAYNGLPISIENFLNNGVMVKQVVNTLGLKTLPGPRYFGFIQQSVAKEFEVNGSLIKTTTTTNTFDDFGNATQIVIDYGAGFTETNVNTYTNTVNGTQWFLGRLTNARVTKTASGQPSQTKTSAFTYDGNGLLNKEEIEPGNATLRLTKQYTRDTFGNITQTNTSGPNVTIRVSSQTYNPKGRFVIQTKNALNHTVNLTNDVLGNPLTIIDANGLLTTKQYDSFGRLIKEVSPAGVTTQIAYKLCTTGCPTGSKYFVRKDVAGQPPVITYFDLLDREIRTRTTTLSGTFTNKDTVYDNLGRVLRVSEPILEGTTALWTNYTYDKLNRITVATAPGGLNTTNTYNGLVTETRNPKSQAVITTLNVLGAVTRVQDANGGVMTYAYDSMGNLIRSTDPAGNNTIITYDLVGNRLSLVDPDMGTTIFTYNAYGELLTQRDAKNQTTTFTYDNLGRVIRKQTPEGITNYTFDAKAKAIGQLVRVVGPVNGYTQEFNFDGLGRPVESVEKIDGVSYSMYSTFDQAGRTNKSLYPSGFGVKATYNAQNHLSEVRNAADNALFWQANSMNARGQMTQVTLGNNLITQKTFDANQGWLTTIKTGTSANLTLVQNLAYTYDNIGNVLTRRDVAKNLTETFTYDNLNRLTSSKVGTNAAITVAYNAIGNITNKSDVGNYTYGSKPHAVASTVGTVNNTFTYDANGNRLTNTGGSITYSPENKPLQLKKGTTTYTYQYSPGGAKTKSVLTEGATTTTTIYVGGIYEKQTVGTAMKEVHYINVGGETIAIYTKPATGTADLKYMHADNLGSPHVITSGTQAVLETLSFDTWGNRRNATTWTPGTATSQINRGYTDHEQLDKVSLVHMGGRVYDPIVARFASPDPFVQSAGLSQNHNRYSYVLNNPLRLVDPTGYNWISDAWDEVEDFFEDNWKPIVAVAVGIATGGWAAAAFSGFWGGIGAAAIGGFGSAFAGSLLNGGNIGDALKAGLIQGFISGATAGLSYGIGEVLGHATHSGNILAKTLAHGAVGGGVSVAQGGDFKSGFWGSAASAFMAPAISKTPTMGGKIAMSAVVGGTVSELSGGKFANGAVTAAFQRIFNEHKGKLPGGIFGGGAVKGSFWGLGADVSAKLVQPFSGIEDMVISIEAGVNVTSGGVGCCRFYEGGMYSSDTEEFLNSDVYSVDSPAGNMNVYVSENELVGTSIGGPTAGGAISMQGQDMVGNWRGSFQVPIGKGIVWLQEKFGD